MPSPTIVTATTIDGDTREYAITPYAMIKAEEYLAGRGQTLGTRGYTAGVFAAYATARQRGDTEESFDTWLATLARVQVVETDEDEDAAPDTFH